MIKIILVNLCLVLFACGEGSGQGLDNNGLPLEPDEGGTSQGATLNQIQADIFGAICAQCHIGSSAPQGLRLDSADNSFTFLVGQSSTQIPSLNRVEPGDPEESYMVHKIEGRAGIIGGRMPLGMPPLSATDIQRIRDWIANGAPRDGEGLSSTKISGVNVESENVEGLAFHLHFSRPIAVESFSEELVAIQVNDEHGEHQLTQEEYSLTLTAFDLHIQTTIRSPLSEHEKVILLINNPIYGAILDREGKVLDGDTDQLDGGIWRYVYPSF